MPVNARFDYLFGAQQICVVLVKEAVTLDLLLQFPTALSLARQVCGSAYPITEAMQSSKKTEIGNRPIEVPTGRSALLSRPVDHHSACL